MTDYRKLLIEARDYLKDQRHQEWPYVENGQQYTDMMALASRIDAALAEPVEPVAWRWKWVGGDHWHFGHDKPKFAAPESNFIVEPLYAAPADQWRRVDDGLPEKDTAVIIRTANEVSMGWLTDDPKYPFYFVGNDEIAVCELDGTIETNAWADGRVTHWMPLPALPEADK